jgi:hypothetical protein
MTTMPRQPNAVMTIDELADDFKIGRHCRHKREAIECWLGKEQGAFHLSPSTMRIE